jgi:hypothetical protein
MNLFQILRAFLRIYSLKEDLDENIEKLEEYLEMGILNDEKIELHNKRAIKDDQELKNFIDTNNEFLYRLLSRLSAQGDKVLYPAIIDYLVSAFVKKFNASDSCNYDTKKSHHNGYGYRSRLLQQHYSIKTEAKPSPDKGWKIHVSIFDGDEENLKKALPIVLKLFFKYQFLHLKIKNLASAPVDSASKNHEQGKQITIYFGDKIMPDEIKKVVAFTQELTKELKNAKIVPSQYGENVRYITPYVGYKNDHASDDPNPKIFSEEDEFLEKEQRYREPHETGYKLDTQADPFKKAFKIISNQFGFTPIHNQTIIEPSLTEKQDSPNRKLKKSGEKSIHVQQRPVPSRSIQKKPQKSTSRLPANIPRLNLAPSDLSLFSGSTSTSISTSTSKKSQHVDKENESEETSDSPNTSVMSGLDLSEKESSTRSEKKQPKNIPKEIADRAQEEKIKSSEKRSKRSIEKFSTHISNLTASDLPSFFGSDAKKSQQTEKEKESKKALNSSNTSVMPAPGLSERKKSINLAEKISRKNKQKQSTKKTKSSTGPQSKRQKEKIKQTESLTFFKPEDLSEQTKTSISKEKSENISVSRRPGNNSSSSSS